ncbi:unnamed protein product [Triticum turgidum subsp. durum]|uniref:Uncharacterized protein n=1 Tax=Triticum turgidum subsp. durum TaxID=4567 RepID=A0A9R1BP77_TRITD|nr:unnamed protein product [Triticum turgidum subsp. durum]
MELSRSVTMDVSLSIPAARGVGDDTDRRAPRNSPSFKIVPLHDEMAKPSPGGHATLGAERAAVLLVKKAVYHPANPGAIVATVPTLGTAGTFLVEFLTTFVLLFVIVAHATDPKVKELIAVAAGAAIMMNALISAESTGASMNPARTLGTAIATGTYTKIWVYMVAPPLGAIAGTGAYIALKH